MASKTLGEMVREAVRDERAFIEASIQTAEDQIGEMRRAAKALQGRCLHPRVEPHHLVTRAMGAADNDYRVLDSWGECVDCGAILRGDERAQEGAANGGQPIPAPGAETARRNDPDVKETAPGRPGDGS